jgi:hypothetical protein
MKFIIDGVYDERLISLIHKEQLPVTHFIMYIPENPIGNSSIFLPKNLPDFRDFENFVDIVRDFELTPIINADSTCQGNLEAHIEQYKAINSFFEKLIRMDFKEILISSPNNIGFVKTNFPAMKIYLSYSQYVTSLNRAKIFFDLGASSIILHPDILRYFNTLKNLITLKKEISSTPELNYILPLNLGCNWGCIQWYQHHNLQSHRTMISPVLPNQEEISSIKSEFDYPLLYCWKKRLQEPATILKSGWISPHNIQEYQKLGYDTFLLFASGFSNIKIINIIKSYMKCSLDEDFNEFINVPHPYGQYWPKNKIKEAMIKIDPAVIKDFCSNFPYHINYPLETEINEDCDKYFKRLKPGDSIETEKVLILIDQKMKEIEKGGIIER